MKIIHPSISILLWLVLLALPNISAAAGPSVSYVSGNELISSCGLNVPIGSREYGCFHGGGVNKIFIDKTLIGTEKDFVYAHEQGHYLMECADLTRFGGDKEKAANTYGLYKALPKMVSAENTKYFASVDAGKFICNKKK